MERKVEIPRIDFITKNIKSKHLCVYKKKEELINTLLSQRISLTDYANHFELIINLIDSTYSRFIKNVKMCDKMNNIETNDYYELILDYLEKFAMSVSSNKNQHEFLNDVFVNEVLNIEFPNNKKKVLNEKIC